MYLGFFLSISPRYLLQTKNPTVLPPGIQSHSQESLSQVSLTGVPLGTVTLGRDHAWFVGVPERKADLGSFQTRVAVGLWL